MQFTLTCSNDQNDPENILCKKRSGETALELRPKDIHGSIEQQRVCEENAECDHDLQHLSQPVTEILQHPNCCCRSEFVRKMVITNQPFSKCVCRYKDRETLYHPHCPWQYITTASMRFSLQPVHCVQVLYQPKLVSYFCAVDWKTASNYLFCTIFIIFI